MAVTITLKTLQQQTFKIRMEPDETVRARLEPGMGVTGSEGGMGAGRQRSRREGREDGAVRAGSLLPTCLTFQDHSGPLPLVVFANPWWLGRRSQSGLRTRLHPRGACQAPGLMSALSRGAGDWLGCPAGLRSPGRGLWVLSFAGVSSGRWWPNLGVAASRCPLMTAAMIMIISGPSFSGPCLLTVCSLLVAEFLLLLILLNLQNRPVIWGLLTSHFTDPET